MKQTWASFHPISVGVIVSEVGQMSAYGRRSSLVLFALPFVMAGLLVADAFEDKKSAPPPKPKAALPVAKSAPAQKAPESAESAAKRRERMKQRDGEIDRMLKGKQHR